MLYIMSIGDFILKLRTSIFDSFPGYEIFVTCFIDEPPGIYSYLYNVATTVLAVENIIIGRDIMCFV